MMTPSTKVILKANDVPIHSIIDMGNYLWEVYSIIHEKIDSVGFECVRVRMGEERPERTSGLAQFSIPVDAQVEIIYWPEEVALKTIGSFV